MYSINIFEKLFKYLCFVACCDVLFGVYVAVGWGVHVSYE